MDKDLILLGHGSGGKLSHQLLDELIIPALSAIPTGDKTMQPYWIVAAGRLAFTTDSYVVDPFFFRGAISVIWRSTAP